LRGPRVGRDDLDAAVDQVDVKVPDLLLRHLDLFEAPGYLLEGQEPTLAAFRDQVPELFVLEIRAFWLAR
jgi:hypothetical protein